MFVTVAVTETAGMDCSPTSPLPCQIKILDALDGLIVRMPEGQH